MTQLRNYEAAINALNSLQSNSKILDAIRKSGNLLNSSSIPEMRRFLERMGYAVHDLNRLNVLHITGTKGKGSTAAFADSILRHHSLIRNGIKYPIRTGLFTSPHLLEVRERIRINGIPISKDLFAKYFFDVWDLLETNKLRADETAFKDKPAYFRYLTLVSLHAFMQEKVDAVILEVGVGGEFDSTNVIEKPATCAISSIGIDHVALLGDTHEKIAWHKAGIAKPGCPLVSINQLPGVEAVIRERAKERNVSKLVLLSEEDVQKLPTNLGLEGNHQKLNGALAVAAVKEWIEEVGKRGMIVNAEVDAVEVGLAKAKWPGRCQRETNKEFPGMEFFMDGAHTESSLQACAEWFKSRVENSGKAKVLIFNCTHERQGTVLLPPIIKTLLNSVKLDQIIFSTNDPFENYVDADHLNLNDKVDHGLTTQRTLAASFEKIAAEMGYNHGNVAIAKSVENAFKSVEKDSDILVTGSLYLVGAALTVLKAQVI